MEDLDGLNRHLQQIEAEETEEMRKDTLELALVYVALHGGELSVSAHHDVTTEKP